jgi:peroxisomal 3,2-trans-enoyl-CoA isomerase
MESKDVTRPTTDTHSELIIRSLTKGVMTLTMNMPRRLNGWTSEMMDALKLALKDAGESEEVHALILTGADPYYCAGVNLGGTLKLGHPKTLHGLIVEHNQALFDLFIDIPKPILVAVNGPALGAAVTSATLCDGIIASEKATFSTPFAALGICPEGCSSVHFERLMGPESAVRMLGDEGWAPTAADALEVGLVQWMVPHGEFMERAQKICEDWIASGYQRSYLAGSTRDDLKAVNARESVELATCFLSAPFLKGQFKFLWGKKKRGPAMMFLSLWMTRPLWSILLPSNPSAD